MHADERGRREASTPSWGARYLKQRVPPHSHVFRIPLNRRRQCNTEISVINLRSVWPHCMQKAHALEATKVTKP
jgi:hypothetical protein